MDEVFDNHLLLEQIFKHIRGIRHLKTTSRVCKLWKNCCERELRHRCHRLLLDHLFFGFPVESSISSDSNMMSTNGDKQFVLTDRQSVIKRLNDYYRHDMELIPDFVVMFNAKLSRDEGWYSALKVDTYRKYMPKECQLIHLENQTIIGTSGVDMCPHPTGNGLAGIS